MGRHRTRHPIWGYSVFIEKLNLKITPDTPKNDSRLTVMIMMGKSIRQIWVKTYLHMHEYMFSCLDLYQCSLCLKGRRPDNCKSFRNFHFHNHSYIYRQNIAPMELAQLGNKSQKISCSFQLLSSLSVNCENNKSNSLQVCDIRFLEVSDFFSFLLDHFVLEISYFKSVGTYLYGYSQVWVFKIWEHF